MKIILMQSVQLMASNDKIHNARTVMKELESNVIPHKGDFISDSFYKDPYEYEVVEVTINYQENECYVSIAPIVLNSSDIELLRKWIEIAKLHKWTCSLDV